MQVRTQFFFFLFAISSTVSSAPWIESNNIGLRADIQLLSDTGILDMPVTTYPLMWSSIAPQLKQIDPDSLTNSQQIAYFHLRKKMNTLNSKTIENKVSLYLSSNERRFTSFGSNDFERSTATISTEYTGENLAGKFQINYNKSYNLSTNQDKLNMDGSYIAYRYSNWVIDIGAIDKWWGPGIDTSLILSSNARPLPTISIKRDNTQAFETPWLNWIGPWTFTAQIAQLEHDRFVAEAKLWSARATFKPFKRLELGLSWSYQWGGKNQPESFQTFIDGLLGETECFDGSATCDDALLTKLGNQLAGYDIRWGDSFSGIPYAIYAQTIGEDSPGPETLRITDQAFLYGIETQFSFVQQRILLNLEYTDTQVSCASSEDTSQDCFYEHGLYRSGYRYLQRSIGSSYDNDAKTITLTAVGRLINGDYWQIKTRKLKLNSNNRDLFPDDPLLGNTVSKVAELVDEISFEFHKYFKQSKMMIGISFQNSTIDNQTMSESNFYMKYDYLF